MYKIIQNDKVVDIVRIPRFIRFLATGHIALTDKTSAHGIVGSDNKTLYSFGPVSNKNASIATIKEITVEEIGISSFSGFRNGCLITANYNDKHNTMTIGWGGFGVLWRKNVATVYVRENRYTYEFIEKGDYFTISFYADEYKKELGIYGSKSGRDYDKDALANFHPIKIDEAITYEEAYLTIVCKKLYQAKLEPEFYLNEVADEFYKMNDDGTRHHLYIGEIIKILKK